MTFDQASPDKSVIISGATWNKIIARLEAQSTDGRVRDRQDSVNPVLVKIRNDTGTNLDPHKVVQIGAPVVLPGAFTEDLAFKSQQVFIGEETTASTTQYGITIEGIPADIGSGTPGVGRVVTFGVTVALAEISDINHGFLKTNATAHQLESTTIPTGIRILYRQGVGSDQLCKVQIGLPVVQPTTRIIATFTEAMVPTDASKAGTVTSITFGPTVDTVSSAINLHNDAQIFAADIGDLCVAEIRNDGGYDIINKSCA